MVLGSSYGDENEIQHFTERKTISGAKYWVFKENDLNSREKCELKKVVSAQDILTNCTEICIDSNSCMRHNYQHKVLLYYIFVPSCHFFCTWSLVIGLLFQ